MRDAPRRRRVPLSQAIRAARRRPLVDPSTALAAVPRNRPAKQSLQIEEADGETRTPDPFITSAEQGENGGEIWLNRAASQPAASPPFPKVFAGKVTKKVTMRSHEEGPPAKVALWPHSNEEPRRV
jgi:hypothetical protein